jgi:hypothetical protein
MSNNTALFTIIFKLTTTSIGSSVSTLFFHLFWMAYQTMINAAVSRQNTPKLHLTPSLICLARAWIPWMSPVDNICAFNMMLTFQSVLQKCYLPREKCYSVYESVWLGSNIFARRVSVGVTKYHQK